MIEDAALVGRARRGDADAFAVLVRRHLPAGYAVALALTGEPADAEDVCQDAFVSALECLEDCRSPDRFRSWLLEIVRNRARDLLRARSVRRTLPLEAAATRAAGDDPLRESERAELRRRLTEALGALPEVRRLVLLLHDLEGWRHREIATELGLSEGTVRSHLYHARRQLRKRLDAGLARETSTSRRSRMLWHAP